MSISMNKSSEATTQLNLPISYIINSSLLDDCSLNSFYSPRPGSVTVIGKRVFSNSCVSPSTVEDSSRFPIPIKSFTRLKKQNTQVRMMLSKKHSKTKCKEQPAPPSSKPKVRLSTSAPKLKLPERPAMKIPRPVLKLNIPQEVKIEANLTERSSVKINQLLKKSARIERKKKKKLEKAKKQEKIVKIHKKMHLDERNSRIRAENSSRFRMEKFTPKAAWGIDERKFEENEKVLRDIEALRESRRALKKSPEYSQRRTLGLSKFFEVAEEIGFRPRSSSIKTEAEPVPPKQPKKSDPKVKKFIKLQKKHEKEKLKIKLIEDIQKETKRITGLKLLDVQQLGLLKEKKPSKTHLNLEIRPKKIFFDEIHQSKPEKIHEENSSDFIFEPDSALKQGVSAFSEDSAQPEPVDHLQPLNSSHLQHSAAIKIQYFYRKHLKTKATAKANNYLNEDTEVQNILASWNLCNSENSSKKISDPQAKPAFSSNQLQSLEQMRQKELTELIEVAKHLSQDPNIVDSLTQLIGNRYNNIAQMLQNSYENTSLPLDPSSMESSVKDERLKEVKNFDCSLSEKSLNEGLVSVAVKGYNGETVEKVKDSEIVVFQEFKVEELSFEEPPRCELDPFKHPYISLSSPINQFDDCFPVRKVGKTHIITSENIKDLSENLISRILFEVITLDNNENLSKSIDKDLNLYINQLFFHTPRSDFTQTLLTPLVNDPKSLLITMQDPGQYYSVEFWPSFCPLIIPEAIFKSLDTIRQSQFSNKDLKDSQKAHDKLIFDRCNEALQEFRPYGLNGKPMPWSYSARELSFEQRNVESVMEEVKGKIGRDNEFGAGKICDQGFCLNSSVGEEEGVQGIREEKIGILIILSIKENEHKWVNYEFEEAQTVIEMSDWVFDLVLGETLKLI